MYKRQPLIEDAAQSQGATYKRIPSGAMGDISVFSFDPMKNMPSFGGGGMVLTDNEEQYKQVLSLRKNGMYNSVLADDHANQLLLFLNKFNVKKILPYLIDKDDGRINRATTASNGKFCSKFTYLNDFIN